MGAIQLRRGAEFTGRSQDGVENQAHLQLHGTAAMGTRLLRLSGNFYGLLKPFCYVTIGSGICLVTVFLLPVAITAGAIADVILGVIFFRAAEQTPQDEIFSTPIE